MAREWSELLRLRDEAPAAEDGEAAIEERGGFFRRLRESLRATREALGGELGASFARTLEAQDWEALEEALISADVGAPATAAVVESLERIARDEHLAGEALRERLAMLLAEHPNVIAEVRGTGLLLGLKLNVPAAALAVGAARPVLPGL